MVQTESVVKVIQTTIYDFSIEGGDAFFFTPIDSQIRVIKGPLPLSPAQVENSEQEQSMIVTKVTKVRKQAKRSQRSASRPTRGKR